MNLVKVGIITLAGLWLLNKLGIIGIGSSLNFRLGGISLSGAVITVDLIVQNPHTGGFTLNGIVGNIFIGSSQVGTLSMLTPKEILPNAETHVPVNINTNLFGTFNLIVSAIQGNLSINTPIIVDGSADVQGTIIPFTLTYTAAA